MFQGRGAATKIAWPFDPNDPCQESNRMNNGKRPGRPASIRTRKFQRRLSDADVAILAHAGNGDVSAGFRNLLAWYCESVNTIQTLQVLNPDDERFNSSQNNAE
jgi:hypothetical protein